MSFLIVNYGFLFSAIEEKISENWFGSKNSLRVNMGVSTLKSDKKGPDKSHLFPVSHTNSQTKSGFMSKGFCLLALALLLISGCAGANQLNSSNHSRPIVNSRSVATCGNALSWLQQARQSHVKYRLSDGWDNMWADRYSGMIELVRQQCASNTFSSR